MPADSRNNQEILKIVHPGGVAEIYTYSIPAAKILEKNPRHCVTRPDVFRFPWVVINPDAVLKPGRVFFIVPYHTIYRLLRRNRSSSRGSCQRMGLRGYQVVEGANDESIQRVDPMDSFVETMESCRLPDGKFGCNTRARAKIDCRHQDMKECEDGSIFPKCLVDTNCEQFPLVCAGNPSSHDADSGFSAPIVDSCDYPEHWQIVSSFQNHQEPEQRSQSASVFKPQPPFATDNLSDSVQDDDKRLKSCLKKGHLGRTRSLRVRFDIPEESEMRLKWQFLAFPSTNSV